MAMRRILVPALLLAAILSGLFPRVYPAMPRTLAAGSGAELVAEVNALRQSNGLAALETDAALMSAAQGQSDYQASIGSVTHSGPDGSRPRDRAAAFGYGGGGTFFVSENIAGGLDLTAATAVQWWQGDAPHINTMLNASSTHIGAGAAEANGTWYYTLITGYIAGQAGSDPSSGSGQATAPAAQVPATTPMPIFVPLATSTPGTDGSITHVVTANQTLWTIAAMYNISLQTLLTQNGIVEATMIFPGDKLVIKPKPAGTLTPTPTEVLPTPTVTPTRTPRLSSGTPVLAGGPIKVKVATTPRFTIAAPQQSNVPKTLVINDVVIYGSVGIAIAAVLLVIILSLKRS